MRPVVCRPNPSLASTSAREKDVQLRKALAILDRPTPKFGVMPLSIGALGGIVWNGGVARAEELAAAAANAVMLSPDGTPIHYEPGPIEIGWQIWFGAFASTIPFVIGAWEFGKRILIQLRCPRCEGSGLLDSDANGKFKRKCPECGGFFPWISWELFLTSNYHPGNGGPLLAPKGQTSVFYKVPPPLPKKEAAGLAGSDSPAPAQSQSQAQEETVSFRDAQGSDKL